MGSSPTFGTMKKQKVIVILGPTASGKSSLSVELARELNGEIISADSRQVYKGLDIGTGKITKAEMKEIPHYLLDVTEANYRFTVMDWKNQAEEAIKKIISKKKVPIICGGTAFYIQGLVDDLNLPKVDSNIEEMKFLEELPTEVLFAELKKLDPERAKEVDPKNRRRLSRAIIIARALGHVPKVEIKPNEKYDFLQIGITLPDKVLKERIVKRLIDRLDHGMIEEVKTLHESGLSYERMDELGLEYKYISQFLRGIILKREELIEILTAKIWQFSKRQKTWWKKNKNIKWYSPQDYSEIKKTVLNFLN